MRCAQPAVRMGQDPSLHYYPKKGVFDKTARRGGVTPPYGAIQNHHPVGAGHAPPVVKWLRKNYGSSVGAAYMPPVAATRILRYTGQTPRNGQDRSLQTYRKSHTQHKIHHPVGAVIDARAAIPSMQPNGQTARRGRVTPPYGAIKLPPLQMYPQGFLWRQVAGGAMPRPYKTPAPSLHTKKGSPCGLPFLHRSV